MAVVPTTDGPTVAPSAAPIQGESINAPAGAFGANTIGAGAEAFGRAAGQVSDETYQYAMKVQSLHNEAAANGQSAGAITDLLSAGSNFQLHNTGVNATPAAQAQFNQDADAIAAKYREGLSLPAQIMYDSQVRRQLGYVKSGVDNFVKTQSMDTQIASAKAGGDAQLLVAQNDPLAPDKLGTAIGAVERAVQIEGGLRHWDADTISVKQQDAVGQALAKQTQLIASTDPVKGPILAQQFYDAHRDEMGPYGAQVGEALLQRIKPLQAADIADKAFASSVSSSIGTSPSFTDYATKLGGKEGTTANPNSSADGYYQFTDKTWMDTVKLLPPALTAGKSSADILAMRHDPAIAGQALYALSQTNAQYLQTHGGFQPTEANLAIAHQFGPQGGVEILASNPAATMGSVIPPAILAKNGINPNTTTTDFVRSRNATYGTGTVDFTPPSPGQQLVNLQSSLSTGLAQIAASTPDPEMRNLAEARFMANANRTEVGLKGAIFSSQQTIYSALDKGMGDGSVTDYNSLLAQPGVSQAIQNLDPQERALLPQTIAKALNPSLNTLAPAQVQSWIAATGLKTSDPYAFTSAKPDPAWTPDLKAKFAGMQQAALAGEQTAIEKETTKTLNYKPFADNLVSSGVQPNTPGYEHFVGAFQQELEDYASQHKGEMPSNADKLAIANKLVMHVGGMNVLGINLWGTPAYEPPADWLAQKKAQYPGVSDQDLARAYTISQEASRAR